MKTNDSKSIILKGIQISYTADNMVHTSHINNRNWDGDLHLIYNNTVSIQRDTKKFSMLIRVQWQNNLDLETPYCNSGIQDVP